MTPATLLRYTMGCGIVLSSVVVFIGWAIKSVALVQIHPEYAPMQYATAFGFLMLGAHIIKPNRRLNVAILVLGVWALAAIYGNAPGPSALFPDPWTTVATPAPGEPAPNTAVCFALLSLAYMARRRPLLAPVLLGVVWLIAMWAFAGYAAQWTAPRRWSDGVTGMSVLTSACFLMACAGAVSFHIGADHD